MLAPAASGAGPGKPEMMGQCKELVPCESLSRIRVDEADPSEPGRRLRSKETFKSPGPEITRQPARRRQGRRAGGSESFGGRSADSAGLAVAAAAAGVWRIS